MNTEILDAQTKAVAVAAFEKLRDNDAHMLRFRANPRACFEELGLQFPSEAELVKISNDLRSNQGLPVIQDVRELMSQSSVEMKHSQVTAAINCLGRLDEGNGRISVLSSHSSAGQFYRGVPGYQAEAFWWGFHIPFSREDIDDIIKGAVAIDTAIVSLAAALAAFPNMAFLTPILAALAVYLLVEIILIKAVKEANPEAPGLWISAAWIAPFLFIPTPISPKPTDKTFIGTHSAWPATFFEYKNQLMVGFSDSDRWRIFLHPFNAMDTYPANAVQVGKNTGDVVGYESPAIAAADDVIMVAYHEKGNNDLYICKAHGELRPDMTWSRTKVGGARVKAYTNPAAAYFDGRIVVVWADYGNDMPGTGDRDGIYCMYYNVATSQWSEPFKVPGIDTQHSPTLAVIGERLVMAWGGYHGGTPIFVGWLNPGQSNWITQLRLAQETSTDRGPALAFFSGTGYLFWRTDGDRIKYATSSDGMTWSAAKLLPVVGYHCHQDVQAFGYRHAALYTSWGDNWQMKYSAIITA